MITRSGLRAAWLVSGVLCAGLSLPTEAASLSIPMPRSGTPLTRSMPAVGGRQYCNVTVAKKVRSGR